MSFIEVNQVNYYYEIHGQGKPIVFISAYTYSHTMWEGVTKPLSSKFQVVLFDNRGTGQTKDNGADFTIEELADGIADLIKVLKLEKPHIVAQSMGGSIGYVLAIRYPDLIDNLIIINSVPKWRSTTLEALSACTKLREMDLPIEVQFESVFPWCYGSEFLSDKGKVEAEKKRILTDPYFQSLEDQQRQLKALLKFDVGQDIHKIKAKTRLLTAKEDILSLPSELRAVAKQIPHATVQELPGAHSSNVECPEIVAEHILKFLK